MTPVTVLSAGEPGVTYRTAGDPGRDFQVLVDHGSVVMERHPAQEDWRRDMRRRARQLGIKIRTAAFEHAAMAYRPDVRVEMPSAAELGFVDRAFS